MSLKLTISVSDIDTVIQTFNVTRIKRSETGIEGPYTLITADVPKAGILISPVSGPYDLGAKTLKLSVDFGTPVELSFVATAPLTAEAAASQINMAMGEVVAFDEGGFLKLESTETGTFSAIEVISGTSLADFGWSESTIDIGEDEHIPLVAQKNLYDYLDKNGDADFYYIAQFYNTFNQIASTDSDPFKGDPGTVVGENNLSLATVNLVDGSGVAMAGQVISIWTVNEFVEVDGFIIGIQRKPIATITTDASGHAELNLVRGLKIKVVFEGTSIIREIVVPDVDNFDLLSKLSDSPDRFDIKTPDFNLALRRTL